MKKYSIICIWEGYNNNLFVNNLINNNQYSNINDNIDFFISGPFINNDYYNIIKDKNCIKILYITEPIEINHSYSLCYDLYKNNIFNIIIGYIEKNLFFTKYNSIYWVIELLNNIIFHIHILN